MCSPNCAGREIGRKWINLIMKSMQNEYYNIEYNIIIQKHTDGVMNKCLLIISIGVFSIVYRAVNRNTEAIHIHFPLSTIHIWYLKTIANTRNFGRPQSQQLCDHRYNSRVINIIKYYHNARWGLVKCFVCPPFGWWVYYLSFASRRWPLETAWNE